MNLRKTHLWLPILLLGLAVSAPAAPVLTNMDLVVGTVEQAVDQALGQLETQSLKRDQLLLVGPQGKRSSWLVDHLLAEGLLARGFAVTLDSAAAPAGIPRLSYRILDLGVTGRSSRWGGQFHREGRVSLILQLSGSAKEGAPLDWQGEVAGHLADRVPKDRLPLLQDTAYDFAKIEVQRQSWGKFVEPVIVSTVLGGLIHLFFSNR